MSRFNEFDNVRLRDTLTAKESYGDETRTVEAGTEGTIVDVLSPGEAFEVEFMLAEPQFNGDELIHSGIWHMVTLTADKIAPLENAL